MKSKFFTLVNLVTAVCFGVALYYQITEFTLK
jgi:hypothetical protein